MIRVLIYLFLALLSFQIGLAQNITGKIIDAKSGESIAYANISINDSENIVSNAEGYFNLSESNSPDTAVLNVSYLGYVNRKITVGELKTQQNTIVLEPGIFDLDNVTVAKPDPDNIMAQVRKNLPSNYKSNGQALKNTLFYREASSFKPTKLDVEITKSTGFTKKTLQSVNTQLNAFTSSLISKPPQEFTDMLCNYYTEIVKKNDKPMFLSKLEVLKATKLKDESRSASLDEMQKIAMNMLLQHLDTTKYYRVKSGLFGSRDTISLRKDFNKKKNKAKNSQVTSVKSGMMSFLLNNNLLQNSKLDFVNQPDLYEYTYEGAVYSNANEFVYIIKFQPKKSKGKYTGKLYVSETDYAVIRADYTLAEGKTMGGFNMKFLLGVKASENLSKGTLIFKPKSVDGGYYLQYASEEKGQYFYVNRPLKFIELTDEEKDVVAFDIKVEGSTIDKTEFLNISRAETTEADIEKVNEEDFKYIRLKRYDPSIWKDVSAIEPLEEMKQFSVAD